MSFLFIRPLWVVLFWFTLNTLLNLPVLFNWFCSNLTHHIPLLIPFGYDRYLVHTTSRKIGRSWRLLSHVTFGTYGRSWRLSGPCNLMEAWSVMTDARPVFFFLLLFSLLDPKFLPSAARSGPTLYNYPPLWRLDLFDWGNVRSSWLKFTGLFATKVNAPFPILTKHFLLP